MRILYILEISIRFFPFVPYVHLQSLTKVGRLVMGIVDMDTLIFLIYYVSMVVFRHMHGSVTGTIQNVNYHLKLNNWKQFYFSPRRSDMLWYSYIIAHIYLLQLSFYIIKISTLLLSCDDYR